MYTTDIEAISTLTMRLQLWDQYYMILQTFLPQNIGILKSKYCGSYTKLFIILSPGADPTTFKFTATTPAL
jgi:hypothetical protein